MLCSFSLRSFSQAGFEAPSPLDRIPVSILKISPLHLINFYPSIQLAYEHRLSSLSSFQLDAGYVFANNNGNTNYLNKRGLKGKAAYRYYIPGYSGKRIDYLSVEPYLNVVNFDRSDNTRGCFDLDCNQQFSQRIQYFVQYREHGISLKYGLLTGFVRNIVFDVNAGLTLRFVDYKKKGLPNGIVLDDDFFGRLRIPNERKRTAVGPALGIRVGYILKN